MTCLYNFSAGPSMLPGPVLEKAAKELVDYKGLGLSVMEMSHRSPEYQAIFNAAESHLRELMAIPQNYKVLFLQGGASSQFAMVPLNLYGQAKKADYVNTGTWAKKAISEAKRYGNVHVVASSEDKNFSYIPDLNPKTFDHEASYFHITTNNTIYGTRYTKLPDTGTVPLVADMSSNILSELYDVTRFGCIYAGAQKNIGPAGLTVVIVREDLLGKALDITPTMFNYKVHADEGSMYNTPATYSIYIAMLVFEWLKDLGGIAAIEKINKEKAGILYEFLDNSNLFKGTVQTRDRSLMNVPFILPTEDLNKAFLKTAESKGLVQLKGHRSVGGMRASIYNPMPIAGVRALVDCMKQFETENK